MNLLDVVEKDHLNPNVKNYPDFRAGDTIAVHAKIVEGEKTRIQIFQGVCIAIRKRGRVEGSFRVRKMSDGVGVERQFPWHSPIIDKIDLIQKGKSRRAKLYYLRERSGKGARIAIDYDRSVVATDSPKSDA